MVLSLLVLLLVQSTTVSSHLIPSASKIPLCELHATERGQSPVVVYKQREVFLELPSGGANNQTATCSIRFRSPFQCPHPYAVQVIEDNATKCAENLDYCMLHQRIYWTQGGELEVVVSGSPLPGRIQLILHVLRLDCDSKLKASLRGLQEGDKYASSLPRFTNKLRMRINAEFGVAVKTEEKMGIQSTAMVVRTGERDRFLYAPQQNAHFYLVSPGFPRNPVTYSDCLFVIPPTNNMETCRLRINFRFFNLPDPDERSCQQHYLVVDNKRICGCKTGLVYLTQLDNSRPKVIRYVNRIAPNAFGQNNLPFGYLLEVQREGCPYRYRVGGAAGMSRRRGNAETVTNKFYHNNLVAQHQRCPQFTFNDWMKVLANPLWGKKRPQCRAREHHPFL